MILKDLNVIKGLKYIPNFVSLKQKQFILKEIQTKKWCQRLKRRQQYYGIRYFQTKIQDPVLQPKYSNDFYPLSPFQFIIKRAIQNNIFSQQDPPNQILVNKYKPNDKLGMHIEDKLAFGDIIAGLSLGSTQYLRLSNKNTPQKDYLIQINDCSIYVLTEQARNDYRHGIGRVIDGKKYKDNCFERISLTIRHVIQTRRQLQNN